MAIAGASNYSVPSSLISDGVPTNGTNETQTLSTSGTVSAGTFRLNVGGFVSATVPWNATTAHVETALNNLASIAAGGTAAVGVAVTGGAFPGTAFTVTFSGTQVQRRAHPLLVLHRNDLIGGGTVLITEGTPGVDAFGRGVAVEGSQAINGQNGDVYFNNGTKDNPTWALMA